MPALARVNSVAAHAVTGHIRHTLPEHILLPDNRRKTEGNVERESSLFAGATPVVLLTADDPQRHAEVATAATRDRGLIQHWAAARHAEPATGERTPSGDASVQVDDGGAGIRFNFPAAGRFRPISWAEWFENFDAHELVFVFERDRPSASTSYRYRLLKMDVLQGQGLL